MSRSRPAKPPSPQAQLAGFVAKYSPEIAATGKAVLARLRTKLPPAVEIVYDNYIGLVIGFSPTERPSEAIVSVVFLPRWITLCFLQGVALPDPAGLLQGAGNQVRHIRLAGPATLDQPAVEELIAQAVRHAPKPFADGCKRRLMIKSISPRQRPRRPSK